MKVSVKNPFFFFFLLSSSPSSCFDFLWRNYLGHSHHREVEDTIRGHSAEGGNRGGKHALAAQRVQVKVDLGRVFLDTRPEPDVQGQGACGSSKNKK